MVYEYEWSTGASGTVDQTGKVTIANLAIGDYSVTIRKLDAEGNTVCEKKETFVIVSSKSCQVVATVADTECPGSTKGSISVEVIGGVAPSCLLYTSPSPRDRG